MKTNTHTTSQFDSTTTAMQHPIDELFSDIKRAHTEVIPVISTEDEEFLLNDSAVLPEELPILPMFDNVLFPGIVLPITATRAKSKKLLKIAEKKGLIIGVVLQKNDTTHPTRPDLHDVGCAARIIKVIELPNGDFIGLLQGMNRFSLGNILEEEPFLRGTITPILPESEEGFKGTTLRSKMAALRKKHTMVTKAEQLPNEIVASLKNISSPKLLLNFISCHSHFTPNQKIELLCCGSYLERYEKVMAFMDILLDSLKLKDEIRMKTHREMDRQQREYFLNQQMRVIQDELGGNPADQEIQEMMDRAANMKWNDATRTAFEKELNKLRRTPNTMPDYVVQANYLNLMLDLPWNEYTTDNLNTSHARKVLDKDHYGLEKVKERILEHIAVLNLKGDMKSPILCLVGPPGTGKTSLGKSIASALGRNYVRVALGGLHDESEIRGHRKTYVGAMPGRIIQNIKKVKSANPVFILDEIDKIQTNSLNGDPTSALLEVLDPEQNSAFHDNYLDLDFDLSKVMFIATANSLNTIQPALLDRMEIIDLSGYILEEKLEIASRHLVPKQLNEMGFAKGSIKFSKSVLTNIINDYTRESGVRQLDKTIAKILRRKAVKVAAGEEIEKSIKATELKELLGLPIHQSEKRNAEPMVGVVTGLAWTSVGGEILFIEACTSPGKGTLSMTGNLGDVMKESATLAFEYIKSNAASFGIEQSTIESTNIHIHVPEGAVPKDGPSAGITMFTAMISALTQKKVKSTLAMTGEITLRGLVTPVGGIKEKILAAKRANLTDIILSEENRRDIEDINTEYLKGLQFHYIHEMKDVLPLAIV